MAYASTSLTNAEVLIPAIDDRAALAEWYRRNRARTAQLFDLIDPAAYYGRPIPLRHPFAFYEGHIPVFSFLTLNERALGEDPIDPEGEKLFERGIDPGSLGAAQKLERSDWPSREQIQKLGALCDERVLWAIAHAEISDPAVPRLRRGESVYTILEHELMHQETLMYIVSQLPPGKKHKLAQAHRDWEPPKNEAIGIPEGEAILGAPRDSIPFGWDNEFEEQTVSVPAFNIDRYPVTNADYFEFVRAGAKPPPFWVARGNGYVLRGVFEELPLPMSWPVYVSHDEAATFAQWKGARLASEAEYHRAVTGAPVEGNLGFRRYDPEPVDASSAESSYGVRDLIGNGWEWTSTPFGPLPGFQPMPSYPQYSADFFDGKHYVMKGASPVTARELVRPSFRNWFYGDYPYVYAKFRLVRT